MAFMSLVAKVLHHFPKVTDHNLSIRHTKIFQYVSAYSIYVIDIMTNHESKISSFFFSLIQIENSYGIVFLFR